VIRNPRRACRRGEPPCKEYQALPTVTQKSPRIDRGAPECEEGALSLRKFKI
jgi:hypothetical protein